MPRKTTILIIILAIVTGLLVFMAIKTDNSTKSVTNIIPSEKEQTQKAVLPYATLYFSPSVLDVSTTTTPSASVNIIVSTDNLPITSVQAELSYDPKILSNVVVTPVSTATTPLSDGGLRPLFPGTSSVPINVVDPAQGRISFARTIGINDQEVSGTGIIATISFVVNKSAVQNTTSIAFLDKSLVATLKSTKSILKGTTPLTITLRNSNTLTPLVPNASPTVAR